ncbi:MAG TPA: DUF3352 domain-containing protein [Patescibacteria group bacterium]|nr:DUF3352 domain-containing protein [Patescibacteria group bacterium]
MTHQDTPDPLIGEGAVPPPASEPADRLPPTRAASIEPAVESDTFGAPEQPVRGRSRARWLLALVGVLVVAVATFLIVSLAGGKPGASSAIGWMPATTTSYSEVRLDLPGDQRQKLAAFLSVFPGFKDQSQIEPKLNDVLDRLVRAASKGTQTWTSDIQPWFGGQVAIGTGGGAAGAGAGSAMGMMGGGDTLIVVTIIDRAKTIEWLVRTSAEAQPTRSTYGGADLFTAGTDGFQGAIAVTDTAMLVGLSPAVKAAVDSRGAGTLAADADIKAALATVAKDYVGLAVIRPRAQLEAMVTQMSRVGLPQIGDTQIDETILALAPTWSATTLRFENDALVATSAGPPWAIGHETANRASDLVGRVPAKTVLYFGYHDAGPAVRAVLDKFRALPETKPAFDQIDQALSLLGGFDAVVGWWGETAIVVSPLVDGRIGGGLVIKPRDAAAAERLITTVNGFLAFGARSAGLTTRTEDAGGTKVTILDLSGMPGMNSAGLPPGYKAEIAWATNADVTVIGYGAGFVKEVLTAGPSSSLGDDARFKGLLARVGADNISVGYVDIAGIRGLIEPFVERMVGADNLKSYNTEIKPYLERLDALIGANRKDGILDRGSTILTVR